VQPPAIPSTSGNTSERSTSASIAPCGAALLSYPRMSAKHLRPLARCLFACSCLLMLALLPACKRRGDTLVDPSDPPTTQCGDVQLPTEPDLMAWSSAARANLASMHEEGAIAVRYHLDGCEPELTVLPNCIGPHDPHYEYKPYSATDKKIARTVQELFAELPLGAASLRSKLGRDRAVRTDYTLVGLLMLPPASSWQRGDLVGTGCKEATHVVARIYLGGFALASGNAIEVEAAASFFSIGNAGASHSSERIEVRTEGDEHACIAARTSGEGQRMCNVPLRIGLIPLEDVEPAPASAAPPPALRRTAKEITIFTDDPTLGAYVEAEVRALGYPAVEVRGGPNADINVKHGPTGAPHATELAGLLTRTLGISPGAINHREVLDDDPLLFINLPVAAVGSVGGRLPGADAAKAALSITVFTGDPATGERVRDAMRAAGYPNVQLNPLPNADFNVKWGQAPPHLVEGVLRIASAVANVPTTRFARQHVFAAEDTDVFVNLPVEIAGATQIPTACGRDATTLGWGPIAVGTKVVLGPHTPVNGDTNWNPTMAAHVGNVATVTALSDVDTSGCPVVHVDLDRGMWSWRIRDLRLAD
jgi:hypothetical protein